MCKSVTRFYKNKYIIICVWQKSVSVSLAAPKAQPIKSSQQMTLCRNETWKTCYRSVPSAAALASIIRRHFRVILFLFSFSFAALALLSCAPVTRHCVSVFVPRAWAQRVCMYLLGKNIMKNNHYHFVRCCDYDCHLIAGAIHHRFSSILRFFYYFYLWSGLAAHPRECCFFLLSLCIYIAKGAVACVGVTQFLACFHLCASIFLLLLLAASVKRFYDCL